MNGFLTKFIICCYLLSTVGCGRNIKESEKAKFNSEDILHREETKLQQRKEHLKDAIIAGDLTMVNSTLKEFSDLNFHFENGETPLSLAIINEKEEIVSSLLRSNTKINTNLKNIKGNTPLHLAILNNKEVTLRNLIKYGANPNVKNKEKLIPLQICFNYEQEKDAVLKESFAITLVIHGAYNNLAYEEKRNILFAAKDKKFNDLSDLLRRVHKHKKVSSKNLNDAVKGTNVYFLDYLLNNFEAYRKLVRERNVLVTAMDIDDPVLRINILTKLIAAGANVNNPEGLAPLINAAINNDLSSTKLLLRYNADPFMLSDEDLTALDYAVQYLNLDIVKELIGPMKLQQANDDTANLDAIFTQACENLPNRDQLGNKLIEQTVRRERVNRSEAIRRLQRRRLHIYRIIECFYH